MKSIVLTAVFFIFLVVFLAYSARATEPFTKTYLQVNFEGDTTDDSLVYLGTFNYGLSATAGKVTATSDQVPAGTNHYNYGGGLGLYFLFPLSKKIYIYLTMAVAQRGYLIDSKRQYENALYYRTDISKGYRNILYLDKIKCIGFNFTQSFSIYLGAATSIRIREKTYYDVTSSLVPKDPSTNDPRVILYHYDKQGNTAIDFLDLSGVAGFRWNILNTVGFSFRYMRDVVGLNTSTENFFKNTLVNSGFYLTLDISLYKNKLFYGE
jgi:hypothetical protein